MTSVRSIPDADPDTAPRIPSRGTVGQARTPEDLTFSSGAAPALWGALGTARGSGSPATPVLDRADPRSHYQTTPDGVISR